VVVEKEEVYKEGAYMEVERLVEVVKEME